MVMMRSSQAASFDAREATCSGTITVSGKNCPMTSGGSSCPSGLDRQTGFDVAGEAGRQYTVTVDVRGVVGTRCYTGGTRASSAAPSEDDYNNWWYVGGTYANPTGWWNTFELHVSPATGGADVYYLNASDVEGGNYCEREATYLVSYRASFRVLGGGTMTFKIHDQNCKAIQNCGKSIDPNAPCEPRLVDFSGMSPPPTFTQPPVNTGGDTYYPQWLYVLATSVTSP